MTYKMVKKSDSRRGPNRNTKNDKNTTISSKDVVNQEDIIKFPNNSKNMDEFGELDRDPSLGNRNSNNFRIIDMLFNSNINDINNKLLSASSSNPSKDTNITTTDSKQDNSKLESSRESKEGVSKKRGRKRRLSEVAGVGGDVTVGETMTIVTDREGDGELYNELNKLLKNVCTLITKLASNYLSLDDILMLINKDLQSLSHLINSTCANTSNSGVSVTLKGKERSEDIKNNILNILYNKLLLIIIFVCQPSFSISPSLSLNPGGIGNGTRREMVKSVSNLIYKLIVLIFKEFFSSSDSNQQNSSVNTSTNPRTPQNSKSNSKSVTDQSPEAEQGDHENKLLTDKKMKLNFCVVLEVLVQNSCYDELIINLKLYEKHVSTVLSLISSLSSKALKQGGRPPQEGSKRSVKGALELQEEENLEIIKLLYRLLQSFQDNPQVFNLLNLSLQNSNTNESIKSLIIDIIDIKSYNLLESIVLSLEDSSASVRSSVYNKLSNVVDSIPTHLLVYVFKSYLNEKDEKVKTSFESTLKNWVETLGLNKLLSLLLNNTLQLDVVFSVLSRYLSSFISSNTLYGTATINSDGGLAVLRSVLGSETEGILLKVLGEGNGSVVKKEDLEVLMDLNFLFYCYSFNIKLSFSVTNQILAYFNSLLFNSSSRNDSKDSFRDNLVLGMPSEFNVDDEFGGVLTESVGEVSDEDNSFKLVNDINILIKLILSHFTNASTISNTSKFPENEIDGRVEGECGSIRKLKVELHKLLYRIPVKFVINTLINEYVKLNKISSRVINYKNHLIQNNPIYHIFRILFNPAFEASATSTFNSSLGVASNLESDKMLEKMLYNIYDPYNISVDNVRIDMNKLKNANAKDIKNYKFNNLSIDQLIKLLKSVKNYINTVQNNIKLLTHLISNSSAGSVALNSPNNSQTNQFFESNKSKGPKDGNTEDALKGDKKLKKLYNELLINKNLILKLNYLIKMLINKLNYKYLYILVLIYLHFNLAYSPSDASGSPQVNHNWPPSNIDNKLLHMYILPILNILNIVNNIIAFISPDSNTDNDTEVTLKNKFVVSIDNKLIYFNNILILKCLCIYNITATFTSFTPSNMPDGISTIYNTKNNLYKELNIYYILLNNIIVPSSSSPSSTPDDPPTLTESANSSIDTFNAIGTGSFGGTLGGTATRETENSTIYLYKLEIILKIVIDLLHIISHINSSLLPLPSNREEKAEDRNDEIVKLEYEILNLILNVLNGTIKINNYIYNTIIKLLPNIIYSINISTSKGVSKDEDLRDSVDHAPSDKIDELKNNYIIFVLELLLFFNFCCFPTSFEDTSPISLKEEDLLLLFNIIINLNFNLHNNFIQVINNTFKYYYIALSARDSSFRAHSTLSLSKNSLNSILNKFKYLLIYLYSNNKLSTWELLDFILLILLHIINAPKEKDNKDINELLYTLQYVIHNPRRTPRDSPKDALKGKEEEDTLFHYIYKLLNYHHSKYQNKYKNHNLIKFVLSKLKVYSNSTATPNDTSKDLPEDSTKDKEAEIKILIKNLSVRFRVNNNPLPYCKFLHLSTANTPIANSTTRNRNKKKPKYYDSDTEDITDTDETYIDNTSSEYYTTTTSSSY